MSRAYRTPFLVPLGLAVLGVSGCMPEPPPTARAFYSTNCVACHGVDATGSGPLAEGLDPRPADLTRITARNGGTFPRDRVMSTIDGYLGGGHGASAMPEFGAGDLGPMVMIEGRDGSNIPVPSMLLGLADFLQAIQR